MSRQRFTALLVAALLVISAAFWLTMRRNAVNHDAPDAPLFPALGGELATVSSLDIRKGAAAPTVSLQKKGDEWTVAQRGGYPADISKLRKLMLALSDAKIVEQKTSDPANYAQIGVDDPTAATAVGTEIKFVVKDGAHSLIVGKPSGEGNFVRRGDEKVTYLAAPGIYVESEPRYWIETKLLDIKPDDITRIEYKPLTGAPYSIHRIVVPAAAAQTAPTPAKPAADPTQPAAAGTAPVRTAPVRTAPVGTAPVTDNGFELEGVPPGRKPADAQALAPPPGVFGSVSADDVATLASIDFSKPVTAVITMKDGGVMTLTGTVVGDKHWIQISAPKNEALATRSAGRAFEIPAYRYDGFFRPLEQLLVPKESPPAPTATKPPKAAPVKAVHMQAAPTSSAKPPVAAP